MAKVTVKEGILVGEIVNSNLAGKFYSFKGIPYAAPPVGDLRFKAPQPPESWTGERDATQHGPKCHQINFRNRTLKKGSEDCLYLNIYTPTLDPSVALPVMIFIHGGGFCSGSGNDDMFGPDFIIRHDVILVTFNYRLHELGLLCLDTEDVPGNAALKDQVAAIKWVKENISNFSGDPNNITIVGQSSGAACVTFHCVSPMTKGLFKRAIAQSGALTNYWAVTYRPRERAIAKAKQLGCLSEDDKELYNFFKDQPWENLFTTQVQLSWKEENLDIPSITQFAVVSEKRFPNIEPFFTGDRTGDIQNDIHEGVELIIGVNKGDGIMHLATSFDVEKTIYNANYWKGYFVPMPLSYNYSMDEVQDVADKMKRFYTHDEIILKNDLGPLVDYYTAEYFKIGILQFAKLYATKNKTYVYEFSCNSDRNLFTKLYGLSKYCPNIFVSHNDDLAYLFPMKVMNQEVTKSSDIFTMIDRISKLWTNFAKTGNPTPDIKLGCNWKPFNSETQLYLSIGNKLARGTMLGKEELELWEEIEQKYTKIY